MASQLISGNEVTTASVDCQEGLGLDHCSVKDAKKRQREIAEQEQEQQILESSSELSTGSPEASPKRVRILPTYRQSMNVNLALVTSGKEKISFNVSQLDQIADQKNIQIPSQDELYGCQAEYERSSMPSRRQLHERHGRRFRRRCSVTKFSLQAVKHTLSVDEAAQKALDIIEDDGAQ